MHESIAAAGSDLRELVETFVRANGLPGASVGLVLESGVVWSVGVGAADLERAVKPDDGTLYRIASITKTFTASAIMALRDAGALELDDPIVRHIPEFATVANPFGAIEGITLRQVVRHTSGLQGELASTDPRVYALLRPHEVIESLPRTAVVIPPDSAYKYSNLGYELLGEVIRRVSGREWEAFIRETLLDPLGMADTVTDPGDRRERVAVGYKRRTRGEPLIRARVLESDETDGSAALWSTVSDLARWVSLQFRPDRFLQAGGAQVLSGATIAEMQVPVIVGKPDLSVAQGLGWRVVRRHGTIVVGHGGFVHGFMSRIDAVPSHRLGTIVLLNGVGDPDPPAELSCALLDRVLPMADAVTPEQSAGGASDAPDADRWSELLGTYLDADFGNSARVEVDHGGLVFVDVDDGERRPVRPTDDPLRFTFLEGRPAGEPLVFLRDAHGRIDGLNAAGYPMTRIGEPDDTGEQS